MTRKSRLLVIASTCAAVALGIVARPAYRHFKERRAVLRARNFLAHGELQGASLSARQALLSNSTDLEALGVMADVAEACGSPQVLDWRHRIAAAAPTVENKLAYAAAALRTGNSLYPLASELLYELRPVASNRVAYCNLAADLAVKLGRPDQAENWIVAAGRLQPTNRLHQLNLAALQLNSTNAERIAEARACLIQLRADTNFAIPASRWLILERLGKDDLPGAKQISDELVTDPRAKVADHLQHLDILYQARLPEFNSCLSRLQSNIATNAEAIYDLCSLLVRRGMAERARRWLEDRPPQIRQAQPIRLALVETEFALKDWQRLEHRLEAEQWSEFEPMRFAFLSQAAFELGDISAAELQWRLAVSRARGRLGTLMWLAAKAQSWGRENTRVALLLEISRQFPLQRWALDQLAGYYLARGDTRSLHQVCARLCTIAPTDVSARNDFANTAFLLKTNLARAHEMARDLFAQRPHDPTIASTYAYSLYLEGRMKESLSVLESLSPKALTNSNIAPYYGAILKANGQSAKARQCSAAAEHASLLPEERALLRGLRSP